MYVLRAFFSKRRERIDVVNGIIGLIPLFASFKLELDDIVFGIDGSFFQSTAENEIWVVPFSSILRQFSESLF